MTPHEVFLALLDEWYNDEMAIIWEYSVNISRDEKELEENKQKWIERFDEAVLEETVE